MTQKVLASKLRVSESTISHWENGKQPTVEHMNALVVALGLSADELLSARGVTLTPIEAADLPLDLISSLLKLDADALDDVRKLVVRLANAGRLQVELPR